MAKSWSHAWYRVIGASPHLFAVLTIIIETLIALSLLFAIARRLTYIGGAIFSFLIWAVAEGFSGPYVAGSTDLGAGIIYVVMFLLLLVSDDTTLPNWSFDPAIAKRLSWWHVIANKL